MNVNKILSLVLSIALLFSASALFALPSVAESAPAPSEADAALSEAGASAGVKAKFIENSHWIETSSDTVNRMRSNGESFVAVFFRTTCFNSNLRKVMLDEWMKTYRLDIYGVDVDKYSCPSWVFSALGSYSVTLPVICIVEGGSVDAFDANDSMKSIHKRLQEYLDIYDETEISFMKLDAQIFQNYATDPRKIRTAYCQSAGSIPSEIAQEAANITAGITGGMEKLKAIYVWVTENIYYNYGMLDGTVTRRTSALDTYYQRSSVCEGYANLTAALCVAADIPCRVVTGFAAGIDTQNATEQVWTLYKSYLNGSKTLSAFRNSVSPYANHAWNEAFVDGRWVILDTTWGSNNDYYPASGGVIRGAHTDLYFDPDLETFSESHLFWTDYSLKTSTVAGDVNADGSVNKKDSLSLKWYLADSTYAIDLDAADVNADGLVNKKDSLRLKQYLAGWGVVLVNAA